MPRKSNIVVSGHDIWLVESIAKQIGAQARSKQQDVLSKLEGATGAAHMYQTLYMITKLDKYDKATHRYTKMEDALHARISKAHVKTRRK
jgi:hypothetical protein